MKKDIIYEIEVKSHNLPSVFYTVGQVMPGDPKIRLIGKIDDNSLEWEDGIHTVYSVYDKEGNLIASMDNIPVIKIYA